MVVLAKGLNKPHNNIGYVREQRLCLPKTSTKKKISLPHYVLLSHVW